MEEKLVDATRELALLKEGFGEEAKIQETAEGYSIETTLKNSELEGGQKIELTLGQRKEIPIGLDKYGLVLSGLPVSSMKVNSKVLEGYNLYTSPVNQDGAHVVSVNFAEVSTRSIVMSYIKEGTDLASLFHEIGHIEQGHTKEKRGALMDIVKDKVLTKYFDETSYSFNEAGFLSDPEAVAAVMAVFDQEVEANARGAEELKNFGAGIYPNDTNYNKLQQYLRTEIEKQYLELYGIKSETLAN
jgi:hypothetical protein